MTLPSYTPTITVWNVRIPTEWQHHLDKQAKARGIPLSTVVRLAVRSVCSIAEEQKIAVEQNLSVNGVRQRMLKKAVPDLPEWEYPKSSMRGNTPTALADQAKMDAEDIITPARFKMTLPLTQAMYYGIKRMAAEAGMEPELFARKLLGISFEMAIASKGIK